MQCNFIRKVHVILKFVKQNGFRSSFSIWSQKGFCFCTVKLSNKERFDKEQIGIKELFVDYQPFYTKNLLLDNEILPV